MNFATESRSGNSALQRYNFAYNRLSKTLTLDRSWLLLYFFALALGLLGDYASCKLSPLQTFWEQVLPNLDYIGIVLAATAFGAGAGLCAAGLAGILHASIIAIVCAQPTSQLGQLAMFAAVGLLAGWMAKRRSNILAQGESRAPGPEERSRDRPLSELARMLPGLVHQFRTPIASIEGAGYVLDDAELPDEKRLEFVNIIQKECRRLDRLVGLLDFTQPSTSDCRELDVARMLDEVIKECESKSGGSTIALRNAARPELPRLCCDAELVKEAMLNLTLNAIRATPQGCEVVLWARSKTGEMIIGLTDQRADKSPEHLYRLFDTAAPSYEHSELDLALVQQIVSRHGGSIRVEPNAGQGVTISLTLPLSTGPYLRTGI